jgi:hypothetical protein
MNVSIDAAYLPQVLRSLALWKKEHKASLLQFDSKIAILCTLSVKILLSQCSLALHYSSTFAPSPGWRGGAHSTG